MSCMNKKIEEAKDKLQDTAPDYPDIDLKESIKRFQAIFGNDLPPNPENLVPFMKSPLCWAHADILSMARRQLQKQEMFPTGDEIKSVTTALGLLVGLAEVGVMPGLKCVGKGDNLKVVPKQGPQSVADKGSKKCCASLSCSGMKAKGAEAQKKAAAIKKEKLRMMNQLSTEQLEKICDALDVRQYPSTPRILHVF